MDISVRYTDWWELGENRYVEEKAIRQFHYCTKASGKKAPNTAVIPLQIIRDIALITGGIHLMMVCANRVDLFALPLFIFGTQWTARLMDY
jgi:hypothetical protein